MKLFRTMFQRALRQQIQRLCTDLLNPIYRHLTVDKPKNLDTVNTVHLPCIAANHLHRVFLPITDTRRPHLNAVNIQVTK